MRAITSVVAAGAREALSHAGPLVGVVVACGAVEGISQCVGSERAAALVCLGALLAAVCEVRIKPALTRHLQRMHDLDRLKSSPAR